MMLDKFRYYFLVTDSSGKSLFYGKTLSAKKLNKWLEAAYEDILCGTNAAYRVRIWVCDELIRDVTHDRLVHMLAAPWN